MNFDTWLDGAPVIDTGVTFLCALDEAPVPEQVNSAVLAAAVNQTIIVITC